MKVVEIFESINGEGTRAGEPAVFVRFHGCNLNCSFCDTKWANEPNCPTKDMTPQEIYDYVSSKGIRDVTLTGGEPLLQKDMQNLLVLFGSNKNLSVEIETNGSVDIKPFFSIKTPNGDYRPIFTLDYKLPISGCENKMLVSNYNYLTRKDTVKFVVGDYSDLERAHEIIAENDLTKKCHVFFSPVFGSINPQEIVKFMLEKKLNNVKLQLQLHKIIWDPNARGV